MKREVIFQMPDTDEYRVVCRYGYNDLVKFSWWGHIQKKIHYKKWLLFGEKKIKWYEIDSCWWSKDIETMEALKKAAHEFYYEKVLLIQILNKQAMEL